MLQNQHWRPWKR